MPNPYMNILEILNPRETSWSSPNILITFLIFILTLPSYGSIIQDQSVHFLFDVSDYAIVLILCGQLAAYVIEGEPKRDDQLSLKFFIEKLSHPSAIVMVVITLAALISFKMGANIQIFWLARALAISPVRKSIGDAMVEFSKLNKGRSFRQKSFSVLYLDDYSGRLHGQFDLFMMGMIVTAVVLVICESVQLFQDHVSTLFGFAEYVVSISFLIEYSMRLYCIVEDPNYARGRFARLRYAVTPGALIDLLAIVPLISPMLLSIDIQILWIFRLLRIFKLSRYVKALKLILDVLKEERGALASAFFVFVNIIILSSCLVYYFEHQAQPEKFSNIPMSIYWAVVTLTSIGYGDIYPVTAAGQILTMLLAVIGIGMVALPAGILANGFVEKLHSQKRHLLKFVGERAEDELISDLEQQEISDRIQQIGMSPERGDLVEKEIFDQLGVIETHYTDDGLRLVFRNSNDRETITNWIAGLKRKDKLAMLALITASLKNDSTTP